MKYDDGSYHVASARSEAHAAAHIGLYLRWCVVAGLMSKDHTTDPELGRALRRIEAGTLSGTKYLWDNNSGKFADVDLTAEGNAFTKSFYSKGYLKELHAVSGKKDYEFTEGEVDFAALRQRLDDALRAWRTNPPSKPWWRAW
jgi:hypothetical protein